MPAKPPAPRPWVVPKSQRLSKAGRPRSGPAGVAVRSLPRLTVRAERDAVALWDAVQAITGRAGYDVFALALKAFVATLPAEAQAAIERTRKRHADGK